MSRLLSFVWPPQGKNIVSPSITETFITDCISYALDRLRGPRIQVKSSFLDLIMNSKHTSHLLSFPYLGEAEHTALLQITAKQSIFPRVQFYVKTQASAQQVIQKHVHNKSSRSMCTKSDSYTRARPRTAKSKPKRSKKGTRPALHEVGGSFCRSLSSFCIRFDAIINLLGLQSFQEPKQRNRQNLLLQTTRRGTEKQNKPHWLKDCSPLCSSASVSPPLTRTNNGTGERSQEQSRLYMQMNPRPSAVYLDASCRLLACYRLACWFYLFVLIESSFNGTCCLL